MLQIFQCLGLVTRGDESAWAVTTPDNRFRYLLGRRWDASLPPWVFGMMNPSHARHDRPDRTMTKCVGFAKRGGAGGIVIVNMLAFSTPYPEEMLRAAADGVDVRGEHNEYAIAWALAGGFDAYGRVIAAWGKMLPRLRALAHPSIVQFRRSDPDCFGLNDDGSPRHPLMLGYDTPIVSLREASAA